jgi:hypothetical protein
MADGLARNIGGVSRSLEATGQQLVGLKKVNQYFVMRVFENALIECPTSSLSALRAGQ